MLTIKHIDINGAKCPVRYDVNALAEYEDLTGNNFISIFQAIDIRGLRALAFVGLKCGQSYETNKVTPFNKSIEDVGEWIPIKKLKEFIPIATQFVIGQDAEKPEGDNQSPPGE